MSPLFDAYVMVDWSAESRPKTGPDSVWLARLERGGRLETANPPTRAAAMAELADLLSDLAARGRSVLMGCDFNFGFPRGFAARLGVEGWRGVWKRLAAEIHDGDDNANDRFAVAARLNLALTGGAAPFWGCPAAVSGPGLSATRPAESGDLPQRRLTEERLPTAKPVWQLAYAGAVGGQTLLGIPRLHALRHHPWIAAATRVWPFETGLKALEGGGITLAEIYPSLWPVAVPPGGVKDREQVASVARHLCALDEAGRLAPLFAGDPALSPGERAAVEAEEGWVLGAMAAPDIHAWVHDPAEIYRQSFATIRAEADIDALPADLRELAVRVVHACGMVDVVADLAWSEGAAAAGRAALAAGAPILVDAEMVAHGVIRARLPAGNRVICTLNDPETAPAAAAQATTRSAAAIDRWLPHLAGAVVAIGNAPTALFRLLELVAAGAPRPALVLGFPVGFVGAAESKQALAAAGLPFVAVMGRRGGSAMAAAAINALAGGLA